MIHVANQAPRVAVVERVAAPRKRFVSHAHAARGGALAELRQVVDEPRTIRDGKRRAIRAEQNEVGAELLHDVELALHPLERPRALLGRHAFEIPKRLEQSAPHAGVADDAADFARACREAEQIVLENLDAVEPGFGDRANLAFERTANGNGSDRSLHRLCYELVRTHLQATVLERVE